MIDLENISNEVQAILTNIDNWSEISEDEPFCAKCKERVIDDVPLRLWKDNGNLEISFHFNCFFGDEIK